MGESYVIQYNSYPCNTPLQQITPSITWLNARGWSDVMYIHNVDVCGCPRALGVGDVE